MVRKVSEFGTITYYNEQGLYHREDGPAIKYPNGEKQWWFNDLRHRIDGAAIEYIGGKKSYFIMGKNYSYEDWLAIKDYPLLW